MNPWHALQPHDAERFGAVILDPKEQARWSGAVFLGGLPYMWNQATDVKNLIYDRLHLSSAKRVLLIGESNESCNFVSDLHARLPADADVRSVDVIERARTMCFAGETGKNGRLGTWRWDYVDNVPDNHYDAIAILQGVQHTEDWAETAKYLVRVLKPGGFLATGEISLGPSFMEKIHADIHIQYLVDKLFAGINMDYRNLSYWSIDDLRQAFGNSLIEQGWMVHRGIEVFWGRKPTCPDTAHTA
jgi:SAM-dependent methyltransferase